MDGGGAVYAYDGEGRRMKKTVGSETTYYFYGVGGLLCEFTTTNTGATAAASTDKTFYQTSDKLGSAVLLMASNGAVIENNRSLPYGETWSPDVTPVQKRKFTTYERDAESNLDYAMNRYYASWNGRFMSEDPSDEFEPGMPSTLNRYVYSANDPINFIDPDGAEITVPPLTSAAYETCVGRLLTSLGAPETASLDQLHGALQSFLNSDAGLMGLGIFFELRPNAYFVDMNNPWYQAALGIGFVYLNRQRANYDNSANSFGDSD